MSRRSRRVRLAPEVVEPRLVMNSSALVPFPTLDSATGVVRTPREVALVRNTIQAQNLAAHKHSTIIGLSATPTAGSNLQPRLVHATDAAGRALPFRQGAPLVRPWHPFALAYTKVANPGAVNIGLTGRQDSTGAAVVASTLPGDLNHDGKVNLTDLKLFQSAFLTTPLDAFYNPAADANHNGFVGHGDAKLLLRNMTPLTPRIPLKVDLALAPGQYAAGTKYQNSGGITRLTHVTVVGHTTPGSIVFADSGLGDYTFTGPALAADANGNFAVNVTIDPQDALHNTEYLVIDPYGQQKYQAFPILYIGPSS